MDDFFSSMAAFFMQGTEARTFRFSLLFLRSREKYPKVSCVYYKYSTNMEIISHSFRKLNTYLCFQNDLGKYRIKYKIILEYIQDIVLNCF